MKEKKITREDISRLEGDERMKYEIAEELGLLEKVEQLGWKGLTAKESGRIGGIMGRRKIEARKQGTVQEGNLRDE